MKLQTVKGTSDILPERQARWRLLYDAAATVLARAGAGRIDTPVFEYAELFDKSVGESADLVVQKEMYSFSDRGGRLLTLRPEFTASVMRAFIEHGMHTRPLPVKLYTGGPAFRAENVQRGRFRQFHQVNFEIIGIESALADAEAVQLLDATLRASGLTKHTLKLGSVGDPDDRAAYNRYLRSELEPLADRLSETSRERLRLNPMRVLDSKDRGDQALIANLERPLERLGEAARAHFNEVRGHLDEWGVSYEIDPAIVRGLDYYRRTAFEAHYPGIGAQSALGGGGRYDGLIKSLGGPDLPGVGWALGVERVLDALDHELGDALALDAGPDLFVVPLDEAAVSEAAALAQRLRREFRVEHAYLRRNPSKGLRDAERSGAKLAALRGEAERQAGGWLLKDLVSGTQRQLDEAELASVLRANQSAAAEAAVARITSAS